MTRRQAGGSLVELMVGLSLSLVVMLGLLTVVSQAAMAYQRTDQEAWLQDQGVYALEVLRVALQQVGHVDASRPTAAILSRPAQGAVFGLDDVTLSATAAKLDGAKPGGIGGSDAVAIHFSGEPQGLLRNCAGMPVPDATSEANDHGWSILHVATDGRGEPELRCKYHGDTGWVSQALVAGVASFQLLYGLDHDSDGLPDDFINASRVTALDTLGGAASSASAWTRVVAVHVAVLLRTPQTVGEVRAPADLRLFGKAYAAHAGDDPGTLQIAAQLRADRLYRQFDALIFLHNSLRPAS